MSFTLFPQVQHAPQPTCRTHHLQRSRCTTHTCHAGRAPPAVEEAPADIVLQTTEPLTASSISKATSAATRGYRRVGSTLTAAHAAAPSSPIAATQSASSEVTLLSRAAYQGVPGAFSEMAALKACPGYELLPCEQFEVAFQALSQWMAERAVLPIENSLGGSIHTVYDLLLRYNLHIVGETSIAVKHCLMALPGTRKSELKRVLSHPQALAQTDTYLRKLGVIREAVDDTAGAAKMIQENGWKDAGAVASARAAELYGMNILDTDIQDMEANITRFLVLSRDPYVITDPNTCYKTSIVFSLQEGPGNLFKALSVFALRDIDLTKIESRPMRSNPIVTAARGVGDDDIATRRFNFLFYIDFVGSLADPTCQNALRHLQEIAPFLRVLGSYPMDMDLGGLGAAAAAGGNGGNGKK